MISQGLEQTLKKFFGNDVVEKTVNYKKRVQIYLVRFFYQGQRSIRVYFSKEKPDSQKTIKYSSDKGQTFFGYYDITPFSKNNSLLLATVGPKGNYPPKKKEEISVGYFNCQDGSQFNQVGSTSTWCWQQGCRLQWYPGDENKLIIYNTMVNGFYGAVIQNIYNKKVLTQYERPIYDIDGAGKYAITLNFSRLHRLRPGYGYVNIPDPSEGEFCPDDDGIWIVDLSTKEVRLLLNLRQLSCVNPLPSMKGAEHYINHLSFNPSGQRFMFLHLWVKSGHRHSRLFTSDINGDHLFQLTNSGSVSHYTWKSEKELLVTIHYEHSGTAYYLFNDNTSDYGCVGRNELKEDGHPSYSMKGTLLLTDTYPDKYGRQHLRLYSSDGKLIELGSFLLPIQFFGEVRCDLHPRWDRQGKYICFDSPHEDYCRAMYMIDISHLLMASALNK